MRREAQQIIPGLLLGPFQASTNADKLRALGVTHMWVIRRDGADASVSAYAIRKKSTSLHLAFRINSRT